MDRELRKNSHASCFSGVGRCCCVSYYIFWNIILLIGLPLLITSVFCPISSINEPNATCFSNLKFELLDCGYLLPMISISGNGMSLNQVPKLPSSCNSNLSSFQLIQTLGIPF